MLKFLKYIFIFAFFLNSCSPVEPETPLSYRYHFSEENSTCSWDNVQRKDINNYLKFPGCDSSKPFPQMVKIPNFKNAWQIMHSCNQYSPRKVSVALQTFYRHWKRKFGDPEGRVLNNLNGLLIEWGPEKKTSAIAYNIDGNKVKKPIILGLALSSGWIWVHTSEEPMHRTIGNTSFIHELVHIALWSSSPHFKPDQDHEGPVHKGWEKAHTTFIFDVNFKLMDQGL